MILKFIVLLINIIIIKDISIIIIAKIAFYINYNDYANVNG